VRQGTWTLLAVAGFLVFLSLPAFPNDLQAFGNNFLATAVLAFGLAWHLLNPPRKANSGSNAGPRSPAVGVLQIETSKTKASQGKTGDVRSFATPEGAGPYRCRF
jgi:hypothetical protein